MQGVLSRHRGKLVPIQGFDELMLQLGERLGYQRIDQRIEQRAGERARAYRESFEQLHRRVFPRPEPVEAEAELAEEAIASEVTPEGEDLVAFATSPAPALERLRAPERPAKPPPTTSPTPRTLRGASCPAHAEPDPRTVRGEAPPLRPPPATPSPPPATSHPSPSPAAAAASHSDLSFQPPRPATSPGPTRPATRRCSNRCRRSCPTPAAHDWWTLKLNIERLTNRSERIAAYRDALARYPDQPELLLTFGRELALASANGEAPSHLPAGST